MRTLRNIVAVLGLIIVSACVKEMPPTEFLGEGEGYLLLDFSAKETLEVTTKGTQSEVTESQVRNFYIFIFDAQGYKKYGQFFDKNNLKTTTSGVESALEDCWYIKNATTGDPTTTGKVKVKLSEGSGYKVYMLANVDSDMVKISSDLLSNSINDESDLLDFNVFLNQTIVYRNTYFPMTGKLTDVRVQGNTLTSTEGSMLLTRLDAKVRFIFKAGTRPDERGQKIKSFTPYKWKVVNVPRTAYAIARADQDYCSVDPTTPVSSYSDYAKYFFDSGFVNFEKNNIDGSSEFAFYMLENRQDPKKPLNQYQDRSRPAKESDGSNLKCDVTYVVDGQNVTRDMRVFEYANDFSTYVVVTGKVDMDLVNDNSGQVLSGDVQYIIHLGDWDAAINGTGPEDINDIYTNYNNFNTERNTSYTYTVTVNSVNNIRVEIDSSKNWKPDEVDEGQPGATGSLTIAKEEIALCDAHYTSKTLNFHLCNYFEGGVIDEEHCIVDDMTWRVETPFNPNGGSPVNVGGIDITEGLDYKWVTFRLNKPDANGNYSNIRRKYTPRVYAGSNSERSEIDNAEDDGAAGLAGYHNDGCMDVAALVDYMRRQVRLWLTNPEASDFDNKNATEIQIKNPQDPNSPKISLTVFVDEYYYTEHPLTHSRENQYLWKKFVNADDRKMQILCNSDASMDGESRSTGSVVTIQQKSIKCMFNTDESVTDLKTAWGFENQDEYDDRGWTYKNLRGSNYSDYNGLINSCYEWGISSSITSNSWTPQQWSTYLNYEVDNDTPLLSDTKQSLKFSCMARNRDNDGDGVIDRDEVRWYTASTKQLIGIYIGADVTIEESRLYNRTAVEQNGSGSSWILRVSSSTNGDVIYAEEGMAVGDQASEGRSVRCARNLGDLGDVIAGNGQPETYSLTEVGQDYISVEVDPDEAGSYIFTNIFINNEALRYYSSGELPVTDERAVENRLYKKFKTAPTVKYGTSALFWGFNQNIDNALARNEDHPYCPEGYRAPNQRELAMMRYYTPNIITSLVTSSRGILSRTKWYFGVKGDGTPANAVYDKYHYTEGTFNTRTGFCIATWGDKNLSLGDSVYGETTRCVRDIRVD